MSWRVITGCEMIWFNNLSHPSPICQITVIPRWLLKNSHNSATFLTITSYQPAKAGLILSLWASELLHKYIVCIVLWGLYNSSIKEKSINHRSMLSVTVTSLHVMQEACFCTKLKPPTMTKWWRCHLVASSTLILLSKERKQVPEDRHLVLGQGVSNLLFSTKVLFNDTTVLIVSANWYLWSQFCLLYSCKFYFSGAQMRSRRWQSCNFV